mmetsp:Transcript_16404/g.55837  ORF Transcript_16404/g.55837 Transcript_16404/m.55837 type:complete len:275 (+) Transcript_16404:969-1793(+)
MGLFHHGKSPGTSSPRLLRTLTRYPAAAASWCASLSRATKGMTHSVTLKPRLCSSSTIAAGSGNLAGSNSRSPYALCHRSSISITLRVMPRLVISSAYLSTFSWLTAALYRAHVVQMGAAMDSSCGGEEGRGSVHSAALVASRTSAAATSATLSFTPSSSPTAASPPPSQSESGCTTLVSAYESLACSRSSPSPRLRPPALPSVSASGSSVLVKFWMPTPQLLVWKRSSQRFLGALRPTWRYGVSGSVITSSPLVLTQWCATSVLMPCGPLSKG